MGGLQRRMTDSLNKWISDVTSLDPEKYMRVVYDKYILMIIIFPSRILPQCGGYNNLYIIYGSQLLDSPYPALSHLKQYDTSNNILLMPLQNLSRLSDNNLLQETNRGWRQTQTRYFIPISLGRHVTALLFSIVRNNYGSLKATSRYVRYLSNEWRTSQLFSAYPIYYNINLSDRLMLKEIWCVELDSKY